MAEKHTKKTKKKDDPCEVVNAATMHMVEHVAKHVQLRTIRLIESQLRYSVPNDNAEIRIGYAVRREPPVNDTFGVLFKFVLTDQEPNSITEGKSDDGLLIQAVFRVEYQLESLPEYSDDELSAFSEVNGSFNTWPYWREYVHSCFSRMGLKSFTLPLFRIRSKAKKTKIQKEAKS